MLGYHGNVKLPWKFLKVHSVFIYLSCLEPVKDTLKNGGIAKAITIPGIAGYSRKEMDDVRSMAISFGAKGIAWITYMEDGEVK